MISISRILKKCILLCFCTAIFAFSQAYGQEEPEKVNLSIDVANIFIWRGLAHTTTPVVQPIVTFSPVSKLSFGAWASTPFSLNWGEQPSEVDIFIDFQIAPFLTLNVTDYFVYEAGSPDYFNMKKQETGHAFDVQLIFASDNSPFKALVSTIFASADLNDKGKNNFSTYIELGYGKSGKHVDWELFAGAVPMKSDFYGLEEANVINLGFNVTKNFQINPTCSLPLSLKFTVNPAHKAAFLTAAVTLF